MDYYYYDQLKEEDNELDDNEDYDYDSIVFNDETLKELYEGCIKSSTKQIQHYIVILIGCGLLQRLLWELLKRTLGNRQHNLYHGISVMCGLISLWCYVGHNSIFVLVHVMNLCLFLWLVIKKQVRYTGAWLCMYTIVCQLLFEFLLKTEHYETIRGPQMVISMKLISMAFEIQDDKEHYQFMAIWGYLLSPGSLILGPWISYKDYNPEFHIRFKKLPQIVGIILNILLAIVFLNLSNCLIPWLKQLLNLGLGLETYLDAFAVRCSHYFVCYLSQATLMATTSSQSLKVSSASSLFAAQHIVKPLAIEFPRSLSNVIRNWNIPMHLWLKQNIFNRLRTSKHPYFMAIVCTYLVSCLVHGFNYKVHLVLVSLGFFSYIENVLRRCLAQVFNACIESSECKTNCKYLYCPRSYEGSSYTPAILLVRLVNLIFSLLVVIQLAYLGIMLNSPGSTSGASAKTKGLAQIFQVWSNINFLGHGLAMLMFIFYKCI